MRTTRARRPVETLERRCLLAFNGTAGPDTIIIRSGVSGPGQFTTIQINGGPLQNAGGALIEVNALGGDDTVYFFQLQRSVNTIEPFIQVNLGDGDDYASSYNPATGVFSTADLDFGLYFNGGAGNDTLALDSTGGGGLGSYTFKLGLIEFPGPGFSTSSFGYGTTMENVTVDGSAGAESFVLLEKPAGLKLTASGRGGDDLFFAGGVETTSGGSTQEYNFSENGWVAGTTTLAGGDGADQVRFYDNGAAAGTHAANPFTFAKAGQGFNYFAIEAQRISPSTGSTVQLNSMSTAITSTLVLVTGATVNVGNGNLGSLPGSIHVSMFGLDANVLNINDANDTGNDVYLLTPDRLEKNPFVASQVITWFGANTATLNTGQGGTSTFIRGTAARTTTVVNGGAGPDIVRLNAGDVDATILGPTFINGGGNIDEVSFDDRSDATAGVVTLDGGTFTDGHPHATSSVERLTVEAGGGPGAVLNVPRVTADTTVSANFDTPINIGAGNLDANLLSDLYVAGGGRVTVDDRLDVDDDPYVVNGLSFRKTTPGARTVSMGNVAAGVLQAGDGDNDIFVDQGVSALSIHANGGNDRIEVADTGNFFGVTTIGVDTGTERAAVFPFGDELVVDSDAGTPDDVGARVRLLNDDALRALTVRATGRVQVPSGVALRAATVTNAGQIDLAGGALLLGAGATADVRSWLRTGRNGGTWDGTGPGGAITSSLAAASAATDGVGYGLGVAVAPAAVGAFAIAAGDTLVRHTLDGDANLNLAVGFDDLVRLAQNYNTGGRAWSGGDFDYDAGGGVGFADLVKLAQNYGQTLAAPATAPATLAAVAPARDRGRGGNWRRVDGA